MCVSGLSIGVDGFVFLLTVFDKNHIMITDVYMILLLSTNQEVHSKEWPAIYIS